jgi:hypothetical protein
MLYTAARQDNLVYQWDLRNTSTFVHYFERSNCTNQRTTFDLNGRYIVLGNDVPLFVLAARTEQLRYMTEQHRTSLQWSATLSP